MTTATQSNSSVLFGWLFGERVRRVIAKANFNAAFAAGGNSAAIAAPASRSLSAHREMRHNDAGKVAGAMARRRSASHSRSAQELEWTRSDRKSVV